MEMNELPKRYQVISLKIDKEIVKKLKLIASKNERSVLGHIRWIIKEHIKWIEHEEKYNERSKEI